MKRKFRPLAVAIYSIVGAAIVIAIAQVTDFQGQFERRRQYGPSRPQRPNPPGMRPRNFAGRGPNGPAPGDFPIRHEFDKDGNRILDAAERKAARAFLQKEIAEGGGPRRGPGGGVDLSGPDKTDPARKVNPADFPKFGKEPLYDPFTVRTFFIEFEDADWQAELADFYHTEADVPARVQVDDKTFNDVGVHFHGASSFFTVRDASKKHSLVLSLDMAHDKQKFLGHHTLDLLNAHLDPSFLRSILYLKIAREYIPAPQANFARVVINGSPWGVYVSAEHFNKDFVQRWFPKSKGARWKVPGSPRAQGGLKYLGEEIAAYKRIYEIKSKDEPSAWADLIRLCRILSETPLDKLEAASSQVLDVDGALKFLALENIFINNDGYWIRSSDYNLCEDAQGRFHIVPHDANETFSPPEHPGSGRAGANREPETVDLDPLAGADDSAKVLLNRLTAVPNLRARYFGFVRQITEESLDWNKLGPFAQKMQALILDDVKNDAHKLYSTESFEKSLIEDVEQPGFRGPHNYMALKNFIEKRRAFLLQHPEVKKAIIPK
jgi:hypothetical protein